MRMRLRVKQLPFPWMLSALVCERLRLFYVCGLYFWVDVNIGAVPAGNFVKANGQLYTGSELASLGNVVVLDNGAGVYNVTGNR